MKFLNLIRHGNSESDFLKNDFDRELDQVGHNNCKNLDSFLYRYSFKKHKILCSSSKRTSQTLESLRFSLNENSKIIYDENIYLANMKTLYNLLVKESSSYMITIIGHNPGLSDLLSYLTGNYGIPDLETCSVAQIIFDNPKVIIEGSGKLKFMIKSANNGIISLI